MSTPILAHVVKETVQERLQSIAVEIDEKKVHVAAFRPARAWFDPLVLTVIVTLVSAIYWLFVHAAVSRTLSKVLGF